MWLPTVERRLLAGYYRQIGEVAETKVYRVSDLRPLLAYWKPALAFWKPRLKVPEYGDAVQPCDADSGNATSTKRWVKKLLNETNRIERANKHLHERGLIELEHHRCEPEVILITLTVDGYDLGRKYACFLTWSGMWFDQYRNHWVWVIVAFFVGAVCTKLLDFILARVIPGTHP